MTFHTNQSPEFTILPIDLPENRWKPLDIPWSSNRFAWECPVYRLIAKTWADIAEKMAIRTMKQKGWEIFKPNCAPQSLELDHRSKKLKTANPLPFAPNLIPQYRDHLLAFQDCSFVTEAQYQFYAPILNHLPAIVTSLKDEKQPIQELATVIRKALMAAAPPLKETKPDRQATLFKKELKEINNKIHPLNLQLAQLSNIHVLLSCHHHCHHACTLLCRKTMPPNSQRTLDKPSPT